MVEHLMECHGGEHMVESTLAGADGGVPGGEHMVGSTWWSIMVGSTWWSTMAGSIWWSKPLTS